MKSKHLKTILSFLKRNKQINKGNVSLLDKEIVEEQIYELRTYTEGKLSQISFGHSIKGWTDQNGVIITSSKQVKNKPVQKESDMGSTWTKPQQQYLDNMKNEIKTEINQKIDEVKNDINQINQNIAKIMEHLKIQ